MPSENAPRIIEETTPRVQPADRKRGRMSKHAPIIDVSPVASARDNAGQTPSSHDRFVAPSFGKQAAKKPTAPAASATVIGADGTAASKPNPIGGAVQTVVGGAIMLLGVPMLVLPGPGLVAIGGGAVIAGKGIKKILGK